MERRVILLQITKASLCPHPSWIEVDVAQFKKNLAAIRRRIGNRLFCLPVKANGYGHGSCLIAKAAEDSGIDYLGVSCLKEALELRLAGISLPILVFGAVHEDQMKDLIEFELEFSISSIYKAELVAQKCAHLQKKCRVHVEVDTGMRRTGVRPESALDLITFLQRHPCFEIVGVYSHLATADTPQHLFALQQIQSFHSLIHQAGSVSWIWHLANSGGVIHYPESHLDMVRPGLICYGYFPDGTQDPLGEIRPCLSLRAKLSYFKVVGPQEGISYGHLYKTNSQTRIVTIPVGHGDGYRRSFSNQAPVLIRGQRFRVTGAICMDQFMVDIGHAEAYVGDEVTLIGAQGREEISLWELCRLAGSIPHEMLCSFNDRLPRVHLETSRLSQ
jgi:alanine racemase